MESSSIDNKEYAEMMKITFKKSLNGQYLLLGDVILIAWLYLEGLQPDLIMEINHIQIQAI